MREIIPTQYSTFGHCSNHQPPFWARVDISLDVKNRRLQTHVYLESKIMMLRFVPELTCQRFYGKEQSKEMHGTSIHRVDPSILLNKKRFTIWVHFVNSDRISLRYSVPLPFWQWHHLFSFFTQPHTVTLDHQFIVDESG